MQLPVTSGFANVSASSPFAALAGNKSPSAQVETSNAAFEASSFSKLAQSSTSGFGALGASIGSATPFVALTSGSKLPPIQGSTDSGSAFGGLSSGANSGFGTFTGSGISSGFGSLTGGANPFGSNLSALSGSSSFAGNTPPIIGISGKAAKPFGTPVVDEESEDGDDSDSDDEGAEETGSGQEDTQKKDRHFHGQDGE
jgi:Ran-binding protein 3